MAVLALSGRLLQHLHHVLFQGNFLHFKAVFVPNEIGDLDVDLVTLHAPLEQRVYVSVVRIRRKSQRATVLHEFPELAWQVFAQLFQRDFFLLFLNVVVLFILRAARQTLPRQLTFEEVQQYVANRFQVVTPRLLVAQVRGKGSVTGSPSQILAFAKGNMLPLRVYVTLCETKVNDVDIVFSIFGAPDKKVVWLYVPVDYSLFVHLLNSLDLRYTLAPVARYLPFELRCGRQS